MTPLIATPSSCLPQRKPYCKTFQRLKVHLWCKYIIVGTLAKFSILANWRYCQRLRNIMLSLFIPVLIVSCKFANTFWRPVRQSILLYVISQAKEEDLTEEYREERDRLIERLTSGLVPKEKNGQYNAYTRVAVEKSSMVTLFI